MNARPYTYSQTILFDLSNFDPPYEKFHNQTDPNKGMARHMESFGHTWYEISKVKCSAWGCEKKFQNFQEYWQHRYSTHGDGLYNINNGNEGKKFMTDYR